MCNITLLLPTGARHPYRIDGRYLAKRNVDVEGDDDRPAAEEGVTVGGGAGAAAGTGWRDPFGISVYKLKELILREWRDEWESKPASPSSIRLIHFGKLLEDKEQLRSRFLPFPWGLHGFFPSFLFLLLFLLLLVSWFLIARFWLFSASRLPPGFPHLSSLP